VLNDLHRLPILQTVATRLNTTLDDAPKSTAKAALHERLDAVLENAQRCLDDAQYAAWHFRDVLDHLGVVAEAIYLCEAGEPLVADHLLLSLATPGYDPEHDDALADRVNALLE
jgi:hypothetical protein